MGTAWLSSHHITSSSKDADLQSTNPQVTLRDNKAMVNLRSSRRFAALLLALGYLSVAFISSRRVDLLCLVGVMRWYVLSPLPICKGLQKETLGKWLCLKIGTLIKSTKGVRFKRNGNCRLWLYLPFHPVILSFTYLLTFDLLNVTVDI